MEITQSDRRILRDLAKRVAEIAAQPIMAERRDIWTRHNSLERVRPMILIFPEGSWEELLPVSTLTCDTRPARDIEWELRSRIHRYEHFDDDTVVEGRWLVHKRISNTGFGPEARHIPSPTARGAWAFDPVILKPDDLKLLKMPDVIYDEPRSNQDFADAQELFGDILEVKQKGIAHVSFHMMNYYTGVRGLENIFTDMIENPQWVHDAMSFLTEGEARLQKQYIELNLLSLNNDETYCSTGGNGYTRDLPAPGFDPAHVRPSDMWASAETQEFTLVSPEMHDEFAMEYERRLLEPFGLTGYACCDDLTNKLDYVLKIPRMRRVSIAPLADVDRCAEQMGNRAIFSWKPQPSHLVGDFNAPRLREYIKHTLDVTRGCIVEMVLKDTHTCEHHTERFDEWSKIAKSLAMEY